MIRGWLLLVVAGCAQTELTLEDAPCPCTEGYVCCETNGRCVESLASCPLPVDGQVDAGVSDANDMNAAIHLTGVEPAVGPAAGGTQVLISGTGLPSVATVLIADRECTGVESGPGGLRCVAPAGAVVRATIRVKDLEQPERPAGILSQGFRYLHAPLLDISEAAGISASNGGYTATILDIDRDGARDLLLLRASGPDGGSEGMYWQSSGGGRFRDAADEPWLGALGRGRGAYTADFDNDGIADLLVSSTPEDVANNGYSAARLLRGLAEGGFTAPVNVALTVSGDEELRPVVLDLDGDGWLDVVAHRKNLRDSALNGLVLLRNQAGRLTEDDGDWLTLDGLAGLDIEDVTLTDIEGDGRPDVVLCGDKIVILRNVAGRLVDASAELNLPELSSACHNIKTVDFNLDGRLDLAWTTDGQPLDGPVTALRTGTILLENTAGGYRLIAPQGVDPTSARCIAARVQERALDGGLRGLAFHDFDLDGDWDLLLPSPFGRCAHPPLLYESQASEGSTYFLATTLSSSWWNDGSTGTVAGDLDGDGAPDAVVHTWAWANQPRLFKGMAIQNDTGRFLKVLPRSNGRAAWGARVDLDLDGPADRADFAEGVRKRSAFILTATARSGQGPPEALFGLGDRPPPYWVRVIFSDGTRCTTKAEAPNSVLVVEREGCAE